MKKKTGFLNSLQGLLLALVFIVMAAEPMNVKASVPKTVPGRPENDLLVSLPGFTYELASVHK